MFLYSELVMIRDNLRINSFSYGIDQQRANRICNRITHYLNDSYNTFCECESMPDEDREITCPECERLR